MHAYGKTSKVIATDKNKSQAHYNLGLHFENKRLCVFKIIATNQSIFEKRFFYHFWTIPFSTNQVRVSENKTRNGPKTEKSVNKKPTPRHPLVTLKNQTNSINNYRQNYRFGKVRFNTKRVRHRRAALGASIDMRTSDQCSEIIVRCNLCWCLRCSK